MAATKKPMPTKNIERLWKVYLEKLEETGVELPVMEQLLPFMGKRGKVLKRTIRSKKQQESFNAVRQEIQQSFGNRSGSAAMGRAMQAQENKQRREIAVETHRKKQEEKRKEQEEQEKKKEKQGEPEKAPEEKAKESAEEKPKSMKEKAQEALRAAEEKAAQAQLELEQARRDLHFAELIEEFQKGSHDKLSNKVIYEIYVNLEMQGVEPEDIDAYIEKLLETMNDIPDEARALWNDDEFAQVLTEVHEFDDLEMEDFSSALLAITQSDKEDTQDVMDAIRYWANPENNQNNMSFSQFWENVQSYNNPLNASNWAEILEDET